MKKNILFASILIGGITLSNSLWAQETAPKEKKSEEIIIRKNADADKKMTIEIDGNNITVNGKPLSDYHDGDVTVMQRDFKNRRSDNSLFAPRSDMFVQDFDNAQPHALLGVVTDKTDDGVKIKEVEKESSAEKAGLANGDVITKLDDKKIASPEDLMDAVRAHKPGDEIKIYYSRDSKKKDTKAKLGESKASLTRTFSFNGSPDMDGNNFNFKTPPMPRAYNMPNRNFNFFYKSDRPKLGLKIEDTEKGDGVKVLGVDEGSAADKAGIKKDDIITELNGEKINDVNDASEQLHDSDAENVKIKAIRNNSEMNFEVKIPKKLNSANL